jgi:hypothetical protein
MLKINGSNMFHSQYFNMEKLQKLSNLVYYRLS